MTASEIIHNNHKDNYESFKNYYQKYYPGMFDAEIKLLKYQMENYRKELRINKIKNLFNVY